LRKAMFFVRYRLRPNKVLGIETDGVLCDV
jgi:hypothetical protein